MENVTELDQIQGGHVANIETTAIPVYQVAESFSPPVPGAKLPFVVAVHTIHMMSRDMYEPPWNDPGGPSPDDHMWLTPASGWSWDADSLSMGEYVGYPLYLRLRDRLQTLRLPTQTHNAVIQELIDMHDVGAIDHGVACSTLIVTSRHIDDTYEYHSVMLHDVEAFAPLSGWTDGQAGDSFEK